MNERIDALQLVFAALRAEVGRVVEAAAQRTAAQRLVLLTLRDALDRVALSLQAWLAAPSSASAAAIDAAQVELRAALVPAERALESALFLQLAWAERKLVGTAAMFADCAGEFLGATGVGARKRGPDARAPLSPGASGFMPTAPAEFTELADSVRFGAAVPAAARPRTSFIARFVAYASADAGVARSLLESDGRATRQTLGIGPTTLARGTTLSVSLRAQGLSVEDAERFEQTFVWNGEPVKLEFEVGVPAAAEGRSATLKFDVMLEGIVVARIRQPIGIEPGAAPATTRQFAEASLARSAFASYSSQDRARVIDRVAAIRIAAGIDVFLDCHDLRPGARWQPALAAEIASRDAFMLFWSQAAAASPWVAWEWQRWLDTRSDDSMQIHPLENGVPPPERLAHLHMADPYLDLRPGRSAT